MSIRKFEDKMLQEINQIDEGLATKILKIFMKGTVKKAFDQMNAGGEIDSLVDGMKYHQSEMEKSIQRLEDLGTPEGKKLAKKLKSQLL